MTFKCKYCGELHNSSLAVCDCRYIKPKNINFEDTPIQQEIDNNDILRDVQAILQRQTAKGISKYPRTVTEEDHSLNEWIDHACEELIDTLVYLTAIKHKIKKVIG